MPRRAVVCRSRPLSCLRSPSPRAAIAALAQSTNASVDGTIKDDQGGVLPGATVTVVNANTGLTRSVVTGERGSYRVSELPPGRYTVKVEMPGFASVERQDIVLALGGNLTLNFDLKVAAVQESVTVTGQSPLIETSREVPRDQHQPGRSG